MSARERATAYHEAGHAVVAFFWPRVPRIARVTIIPDPKAGTLGHARRGRSVRPFPASPFARISVSNSVAEIPRPSGSSPRGELAVGAPSEFARR